MSDILIKARSAGNHWAYDKVLDLDRLEEGYKRCRRIQFFIPTPEALEKTPVLCPTCLKKGIPASEARVTGEHAYGQYSPKLKRYVVQHYNCSWESLFNDIFRAHDMGLI